MFQTKATQDCPSNPYLTKRGLAGRQMNNFEAGLQYGQEKYKWFLNVNLVKISCRKEITPENVKTALRNLCKRHPHLRMKITNGATIKERYLTYFETDPEPDLEVLATEDWKTTFEDQLEQNFQADGLQWRVKMLKPTKSSETDRWLHVFIFNYNHAIVDGGSISAGIHTNFFYYLEDAVCGKDKEVTSLPLLPCKEAMFPEMALGTFDRLSLKVKELLNIPCGMTDDPMAVELLKAVQPEKDAQVRCTRFITMDLTVEQTGKITQKCKEHGIKFNGYAFAAASIATMNLLRKYTKNTNLPKDLTFDPTFLVNPRRFAKPPILPEQVALLPSFLNLQVTVPGEESPEAFWELAKKCHKGVHDLLDSGAYIEAAKLLNYIFGERPYEEFYKKYTETEIPHSVLYITNRGNFTIKSQYPDEEGSCTFETNHWTCTEHLMNFDVFVQSLQSINGHLMWTLSYYGHKSSYETAKEYLDDIKDILLRMSE